MKKDLDLIRKDINEALEAVSKKHGVNFKIGSMRYNDISFKTTLEATLINSSGQDAKAEQDWNTAVLTGLVQREWRGETFTADDGKTLKVVGVNLKKRKNIVVLQDATGKKYMAPTRYVDQYLVTHINP